MVTVDEILGLLNPERRRYALYYLDEQDGPVSIESVAEAVAGMESNGSSDQYPESLKTDIQLSLHHNHLENADEYEFISYDRGEGKVNLHQTPTDLDIILTIAKTLEQ